MDAARHARMTELAEGKNFPVGTRRHWKGHDALKTRDGWTILDKGDGPNARLCSKCGHRPARPGASACQSCADGWTDLDRGDGRDSF